MQFLNTISANNNNIDKLIVDLSSFQNVPHKEGRVFWDAEQQCMAVYIDTPYVTMNPGREVLIRCYNNTGATITNGKAVCIVSSYLEVPTIFLADADNYTRNRVLGITTMDIPDGSFGEVTYTGAVHDFDLTAFNNGDILYLSTTPGMLTAIRPQFPAKAIVVGQVLLNTSLGTFYVNVSNDTYNYSYDGSIIENHTLTIAQSGANVYAEIERQGGGDLAVQISGSIYYLNCTTNTGTNGKARILLANGTASSPYTNYIFLTVSGSSLSLSTSTQYPSSAYAAIGVVSLLTATFTQTNGALCTCPFIASQVSNGIGRVPLLIKRLLAQGAQYSSGLVPTVTINTSTEPDSVDISITSGNAYLSEIVSIPSLQISSNGCYVANASGLGTLQKYQKVTNINQLMETAAGVAITNNNRYNLVFFVTAAGKLFVNLPSATYANNIDAYNDINNTAVNTVPAELHDAALLLIKLPLHYTTNSGGTFLFINPVGMPQYIDLRGTTIGVSQSSSYGLTPIFADSSFQILDSTDSTSILNFNAANISPATTRTITMPDYDVDLGSLSSSNINTSYKTGNDTKLVTGVSGSNGTIGVWDGSSNLHSGVLASNLFDKTTNTTDNITEGSTKFFFSNNLAIAAVGNNVTDSSSIGFTYSANVISANAKVDSSLQISASGIGLKNNTITVAHFNTSAVATGITGDNTKITTQGYVDKLVNDSTASLMKLQGDWNALTNTPDITDTTTTGFAWRVSVAGTTNLGGITSWAYGDLAVKTDTGWMNIGNNDVSAVWGNITGSILNQSDLISALNDKVSIASLYSYYTDTPTIAWSHVVTPTSLSASIVSGSITTSHLASSAKTGLQTKVVTGAAGLASNIGQWNASGDLIDGGIAVSNLFNKLTNTTDNITEGVTKLFYTDARAVAALNAVFADTTTIDYVYNNPSITFAVKYDNSTITVGGNGIQVGSISSSNIGGTYKTGSQSKLVTGSNGTNGNLAQWNNTGDLVDSNFAAINLFNKSVETSDAIQEGITHLYFTDSRAIAAVGGNVTDSNSIDFTYNANVISANAKVDSTLQITASGIGVNSNAINLSHISTSIVQNGALGDNTKLTTKGYVDNLSSIYALSVHNHATTDIINFSSKVVESYASVTSDPTGFTRAQQANVILSFNNSTRTLTLTPVAGGAYSFYVKGVLYTKASDSIIVADSYSTQYIYYNNSGVLTSTTTFDDSIIIDYCIVSIINYDSGLKELALLQNELHGIMPGMVHSLWHDTLHAQYSSGMKLSGFDMTGTGDTNVQAQFAISAGVFRDEDIKFNLLSQAVGAKIPLFYRQGANGYWRWSWTINTWTNTTAYTAGQRVVVGDNIFEVTVNGTSGASQPTWVTTKFGSTTTDNTVTWKLIANKTFPLIGGLGTNNRLMYNQWTGAVWQLSEVSANGSYVLIHIYASNNYKNTNQDYDYLAVLGQAQYTTITAARTGAANELASLSLGAFPSNEVVPVATIIYRTANNYANQPQAYTAQYATGIDYADWAATKMASGTAPTAHANLTGLNNDDHIQYALLLGRSGGQVLIGGTGTGEDLTLRNNSVDNTTVTVSSLNTHLNSTAIHTDHTAVTITGTNSLTGGGTIAANRTLSLVGDSASPGNVKVYGTNSSGTRGFYDRPEVPIYYSLPEQIDNTSVYFYSFEKQFEGSGTKIYSGNSQGMNYANASNPILIHVNGTITRAILTIKGAGVSNGTVTYPVTYMTDLYDVGFSTEGTKIGDIDFSISNTYTVGTYSVGATNAKGIELTGLNISVTKGQMLALKFINGSGASQVGQTLNAYVVLMITPTV